MCSKTGVKIKSTLWQKAILFSILTNIVMISSIVAQDTTVVKFDKDMNQLKKVAENWTFLEKRISKENGVYVGLKYDRNDQLQSLVTYKDKRFKTKHGQCEYYYTSGEIRGRGNFKFGEKDSIWNYWYQDGIPYSTTTYLDGKFEGLYQTYHRNGKVSWKVEFKANKSQGYSDQFYENGQLSSRVFKIDGLSTGERLAYYKDGNKKSQVHFVLDTLEGPSFLWHQNGALRTKGSYHKGQADGALQVFRTDSTLYYESNMNGGKLDGNLIARYTSGDTMYVGQFKGSLDTPDFLFTDSIAELDRFDLYREHKQGEHVSYFENGGLRSRIFYDDMGREDGKWKKFHPNGQLWIEGQYESGKPIGEWVWFNETGKMYAEMECSMGYGKRFTHDLNLDIDAEYTEFHPFSDNNYGPTPLLPGSEGAYFKALSEVVTYPSISRKRGIQGTVYVQAVIDESGNLVYVTILKGVSIQLDKSALLGMRKLDWRFEPGRRDNLGYLITCTIPVKFKL